MFKHFAAAAVVSACIAIPSLGQTPAKIDFRRDVLPLFKANCVSCHGPSLQMNGFRLDRRRDAMKGGTIAMIGPGNAAGSRLYMKLIGNQFGPQMPPTGTLQPKQIEIIKSWIDQGADWPDDVSGEAPATPPDPKAAQLMEALRNGDRRAFQKMLSEDPKTARLKGPGGSTPLMYAVLYGDAGSVRMLLEKGADPNVRNDAGATALMWAVDDLEKVRLLVDRKADVNARSDDGRTPLMIAAGRFGATAVVKLLLDRGAKADVKAPSLVGDTTPLTEAAFVGDEAAMRMLLDHGADRKTAGPAALALAMRSRCAGCVDKLMKDATPDIVIPAMFFVSPPLGPAFGVKPLLESGGNANAKDPGGNSILMMAAASDGFPVEAIQALIDRGADVNAKGPNGETALDLATRHGQTPVVDVLRKAGAKPGAPIKGAGWPKTAASVRAAVERSIPLLQHNDAVFLQKSGCVSCHNNTLAAMTMATARKSGFRVDEQQVEQQRMRISAYLDTWRERALQNIGIPGDHDTVSMILVGLADANHPPDARTDAMARLLKSRQSPDGHWMIFASRPPLESSDFAVTAVSMRALQVYAPKARRAEYDKAVKLAADWLAREQPRSTEDRAFHLLGLKWAGADQETIRKAARAFAAEQQPVSDFVGCWSQIPSLSCDPYATGQALAALLESGAFTPTDPVVKRGTQFLLSTQFEDGSWYVRRRAVPIQPHFDAGFPYGRDQWISAAATNWAATALALAAR